MMLLTVCPLGVAIFASIIIVTAYRKVARCGRRADVAPSWRESVDAMQSADIPGRAAALLDRDRVCAAIRLRRR